jgi:hypothetical protein
MHKSARDFALKHRLNLGRHANGHYYIGGPYAGLWLSMYPTAKSGIVLMRKFLRWRQQRIA